MLEYKDSTKIKTYVYTYAANAAEKVTGETAGKLAQLIELMIAKILC